METSEEKFFRLLSGGKEAGTDKQDSDGKSKRIYA
jgi:hypothetical protein